MNKSCVASQLHSSFFPTILKLQAIKALRNDKLRLVTKENNYMTFIFS